MITIYSYQIANAKRPFIADEDVAKFCIGKTVVHAQICDFFSIDLQTLLKILIMVFLRPELFKPTCTC